MGQLPTTNEGVMTSTGFSVERQRGKSTTRTKRKTGEVTIEVSLGDFPVEIHQEIKDFSSRDMTVSSIYSDAIRKLRADLDSGTKFHPINIPNGGKDIKIWISEEAKEDLRYLVFKLAGFHKEVVYFAATRWLEDERSKFNKRRNAQGVAP
jgi:hypothetical protein